MSWSARQVGDQIIIEKDDGTCEIRGVARGGISISCALADVIAGERATRRRRGPEVITFPPPEQLEEIVITAQRRRIHIPYEPYEIRWGLGWFTKEQADACGRAISRLALDLALGHPAAQVAVSIGIPEAGVGAAHYGMIVYGAKHVYHDCGGETAD